MQNIYIRISISGYQNISCLSRGGFRIHFSLLSASFLEEFHFTGRSRISKYADPPRIFFHVSVVTCKRHACDVSLHSSVHSPLLSIRSPVALPYNLFRKRLKALNSIEEELSVTHHIRTVGGISVLVYIQLNRSSASRISHTYDASSAKR